MMNAGVLLAFLFYTVSDCSLRVGAADMSREPSHLN